MNKKNTALALKRRLLRHLRALELLNATVANEDKDAIRATHRLHRAEKLRANQDLIAEWPTYMNYFAAGSEVDPEKISPFFEVVRTRTPQSALFALASLYWSVPTSNGYGRRIRILCWDRQNGKLIGLAALGDPVFNLRVRDTHIGWSVDDRRKRLSSIMDAYVLGALPPYNKLLCGKMIACLLKSREVYDFFYEKYHSYTSILSGERRKAQLAMITTTSALGRSSLYNRLKLNGQRYFEAVGVTRGFGHFHISNEIFNDMREYLSALGHEYANGNRYGHGPNWRMRVIRRTLEELELPPGILRHGISREVFVAAMGPNALDYLRGVTPKLHAETLLPMRNIAQQCRERWMVPRANRDGSFVEWTRQDLYSSISKL